MRKKIESSKMYYYDSNYQSSKQLFAKGTKVRKSAIFVTASNELDAINELMKQCNFPKYLKEDEKWINHLKEEGYLYISADEEEALDPETDVQYKYYCEYIYALGE